MGADLLPYLLQQQEGHERLEQFIRRVSPRLPPPRHILEHLIPRLERARHTPARILISMPPRHAKSVTVAHALAWLLSRHPTLTSAYVTNSGEGLSAKQSRLVRSRYEAAGGILSSESASVHDWQTLHGGGLWCAGLGGGIVGKPVTGWLVLDDPFKNREEAESHLMRDKIWDAFAEACYPRLEPGSSCIVIHTRWHLDDLIGRLCALESGEKWDVVELPAIDSNGQALWPEQYPIERLNVIRKTLHEYAFAAQYQQRPKMRGSSVFHEPSRFALADFLKRKDLRNMRWAWALDPALTAKTQADFSAAFLVAMAGTGVRQEMFVVDAMRVQEEPFDMAARLLRMREQWAAKGFGARIAVEKAGSGMTIPEIMRKLAGPNVRIDDITVAKDKFTRSLPVAQAWNDKRVHVPSDAPWSDDLIRECQEFTGNGGGHDDQVDALAHAWTYLAESDAVARLRSLAS
jgi:predicted phage terminase large subunit-like protein